MIKILLLLVFSTLFNCQKSKSFELNLPDITKVQRQEEGFIDISSKIVEGNKNGNKYEYFAKRKI